MTLHYEDAGLRLWHGPNMEILPTFADASFDSIVTDPPYELGFMGKGWDSSGIAYDVDVWRECLRVLKPGGHLLAFGGSRTWHRMAVAIEDAGFEMRDSIALLYGSGFPKSMDVSKAIDKAAGAEREVVGSKLDRPGYHLNAHDSGGAALGAGLSSSTYETRLASSQITAPATESAREWEGWGTALKPAFEPIVVARKPFRGTVAANVLAHGTGALNIDATRTSMSDADRDAARVPMRGASPAKITSPADRGAEYFEPATAGRWPTNVVLDGSQPAVLDAQTGVLSSGIMRAGTRAKSSGGDIYGKRGEFVTSGATYGDSGGASRFFPTFDLSTEDVAWQARLVSLPTFRYEAKAPTSERPNVEGTVHATVKPLALIRWLVRLVTRPGGHVLDLYAGSGTTGEAALLEGMEVDLIELEEDHLPLILARVRKPLHPGLFGDWEDAS